MDGELGDDPTLPLGLTLFLVEDMAEELDDIPSPSTPIPVDSPWLPPVRVPSATPPIQEGPGLKSQPNHPLVDPKPNPNQGQKRGQIQLPTLADGSMWRWKGLGTLTGGKKSKPVGESPWAATS